MRKIAAILILSMIAPLAVLQAAEVHVMDAWSRATPPGTTVGVGYLTLHNSGGKALKLTAASSSRAQRVELHETRVDEKGLSTMRPMKDVIVEPGKVLTFGAGGRHLMLVGLKTPLVAGEKVPLTLQFEGEAPMEVHLDVKPLTAVAPASGAHDHH